VRAGSERRSAKTYVRLHGVEFTVGSSSAMRFRVGEGRWRWVPKSLVQSYDTERREIVVEEWWAKQEEIA